MKKKKMCQIVYSYGIVRSIGRTCRVPSPPGDSGPGMRRGEHSRPGRGWTRSSYTGRTCDTAGTSTSGVRRH